MILDAVPPFRPSHFHIRFAVAAWELRACAALRRQVFCAEQGLFSGDDRDDVDGRAIPICAVSTMAGDADAVVGTVRIHEAEERRGLWWGSRLAVAAAVRGSAALGTGLIQVAVGSARVRGCTRFLAHVQDRNVRLFQTLGWTSLGEVDRYGHPHHLMQADLAAYPPLADPGQGLVAFRKAA